MATLAERKAQAKSALRALRRIYRAADTLGEKVERELDRLIKRKTLVGPDSLVKLGEMAREYSRSIENVNRGFGDLASVVQNIPV